MMAHKQFSYPNLFNILRLFQLLILQIYKKNSKITLAFIIFGCYSQKTFIQVYISGRMK